MQSEGVLLLAIHHLKSKLTFEAISQHVRGHQGTRACRKKAGEAEEPEPEEGSDTDSLATTASTRGIRPLTVPDLLMKQISTLHAMNWQGKQLQEQ
jgi:hypothetical protein